MAKKKQKKLKKSLTKTQNISTILSNRTGGAIAIKGFNFQFLYACYTVLNELTEDLPKSSVRLEGIEDVDIIHKNSYLQVKSSKNSITTSKFWSMGVIKNFLEIYQNDKNINFYFIHDSIIERGYLKNLETKNFSNDTLEYWSKKIDSLGSFNNVDIKKFFEKINFIRVDKNQLYNKCKQLILKKFDLNNNTEEQYLFALLHHIAIWSEQRKTIYYKDVLNLIQTIKDLSAKTPSNNSIKHNYIRKIDFKANDAIDDLGYYDGKSAKPIHIALDLPIKRKKWQEIIMQSVEDYNLTIIKSSSGQGKSTLAWQVALEYQKIGFDIYQLNYCDNDEKIEDILDFFETRIKIGQLPIVVIDGLDKRVEKWDKLIDKLVEFPIKIIVTTREEEWYRFSIDASKAKLNIVNIALLPNEAKEIFLQLKKRNKLSDEIKTWQTVWERIESKKLLIEFIYLLTHGDMLRDRLKQQIKNHAEEKVGAIKLELLRIISLSDIMGIKLKTNKLIEYIFNKINYSFDSSEILKSLSKEYYLQFDKKYIEGLHPVRSNHLVELLHEFFPIENTLLTILKIIENNFIYEYFYYLSNFLDEHDEEFLKETTQVIIEKEYQYIVDALDGLMHYEPYDFWKKNQKIYDEVFEKGLINLFVEYHPPFSNIDTFEELNKRLKNSNINYLIEQKNRLSKFSFENTLVSKICFYISTMLQEKNNFKGLADIAKWLHKTENAIPDLYQYSSEELINLLEKKDANEVKELFVYKYIFNPKKYFELLLNEYQEQFLSLLKIKTNSPTVYEKDNELYIEYIANNEQMNNLNKCSVDRIEVFKEFLPNYKRYHTKAIYLPFPNEQIYKWAVQESYKAIPAENLFDKFDVHLNVIWRKTIMKNYSFESIYEWQSYQKEVREVFLEFTKECNRLFEYKIENKQPKNIYPLYQKVFNILKKSKEFPTKNIRYKSENMFKNELKVISDFKFSFRNFVDQFIGIVDNSNIHLPLINLNEALLKLNSMQEAFDNIQKNTYTYFDFSYLNQEENYWYERLLQTIEFYLQWNKNKEKVVVAKEVILSWHFKKEQENLEKILSILENLEDIGFDIYKPNKIVKNGNFKEVAVAIENLEEGDLEDILFSLVDIIETEINYVNLFKSNNKEISYGFRVPKEILEQIKNFLDGNEFEENEFVNILPIFNIEKEILDSLGNDFKVESPKIDESKNAFIEVMFDIWKFMEYKNRLNSNNLYEKKWLIELEGNFLKSIRKKENLMQKNEIDTIENLLYNINVLNTEMIVKKMNSYLGIDKRLINYEKYYK